MATVIKICDKNGNKYTGFELCRHENIYRLFPNGAYVGLTFMVGDYEYKVTQVYVDSFVNDKIAHLKCDTLDGGTDSIGTHIWICCDTEDPRIQEGNINQEFQKSLSLDLGLT